jgi:hypothetical protein
MSENIVAQPAVVNLAELAVEIRAEFAAANEAGRSHIAHAIAAGKKLIEARDLIVKERIKGGFRAWLQDAGFNKTDAYDYMVLAQSEASVRSSGHSSIAAALRMLRAKTGQKSTAKSPESPLTRAAWARATPDERRRFLDSIGTDSLCAAFSTALRAELKRRVGGQHAAQASALSATIAAGLRQALSLQKTSRPKDVPAIGVASALNAINNKLAAAGLDLNDLVSVVLDPAVTRRNAA